MSHPGYDESSNPPPGELVETAYSGKTDQVPPPQSAPPPMYAPPPTYAPAAPTYPPTPPVAYPPAYHPTAAFQPVPAPPTYDPTVMAQQYSAPPTSGPYGYPGPPMGGGPGPMPGKRSGAAVVTLAILTAVFLIASGVLGTLFVVKTKQANDLRATVAAERSKNAGLARDLDNARRDLDDSQGQTEEMAAQKKAIADCINAIFDVSAALDASEGQTTPEILAKRVDLQRKCDAAEKFL